MTEDFPDLQKAIQATVDRKSENPLSEFGNQLLMAVTSHGSLPDSIAENMARGISEPKSWLLADSWKIINAVDLVWEDMTASSQATMLEAIRRAFGQSAHEMFNFIGAEVIAKHSPEDELLKWLVYSAKSDKESLGFVLVGIATALRGRRLSDPARAIVIDVARTALKSDSGEIRSEAERLLKRLDAE